MSAQYSHLLLATDLQADNAEIVAKAMAMSQLYQAKLSLIHVVESLPLYFGNDLVSPVLPETQELETQMLDLAKEKMAQWVEKYQLSGDDCHVETGVAKLTIAEFAKDHAVDLIVIGSHSRHGLSSFLGSTARAVLNVAPCDVLAVKVKTSG